MRNILILTSLIALAGCATQSGGNMAMRDPATLRASCGAPGTGDMNSTAFRECASYFTGYLVGYETHKAVVAKPGRTDICVTGTSDSFVQSFDKFRAQLMKPDPAGDFLKDMPQGMTGFATGIEVHMALARAYPCK